MRIAIFEDSAVRLLEPISFSRPAFDIKCGASSLLARHKRLLGATEIGTWVRPQLSDLTRLELPDIAINDPDFRAEVWLNARWLPPIRPRIDASAPHAGLIGQSVAYIVAPPVEYSECRDTDHWLAECKARLPQVAIDGSMIDYLWDAVDHNGDALCHDWEWFHALHGNCKTNAAVIGPPERLVVAEEATIEPYVTADTRQGPVLIDRGAVVHSFSRLEGPCYIGPESLVLGAKIRGGTSLGPRCRVGGEVEASILHANSNKYHEGFLGHSYVGEWVNLAAGTHTSDLRNDYGTVRVVLGGQRISTGRTKIGSYIGDHTKTGLGALLNTGSVIGSFCNLLPSGSLLPAVIPSFCQVSFGSLQERVDLRQLFNTAATVMRRRGSEWTDVHREFFYTLFDDTAEQRHKTIRDSEIRRLRRSV